MSKQIPVSTSDPRNSKLLTGVTGVAGLALEARLRRQKGLFIPGTGSLQV
ncbi:MAG TPA: hypothetical protein VK724_27685 [Bryobacteraceae bacterium]|nr:hypothetical protein [Bryobacteraceae bacterium]